MNRLLYAAALIAVALPSVVIAEEIVLPPTQEEIDKFNECLRGKASIECVLPTRTVLIEPAAEENERPFFRYACMSEGWVCPRHVGVWGNDETRADDSGAAADGTADNSGVGRSVSAPPSAAVDRPSRDRDTDRGRSGRSGRDRSNPCRN